MTPTTAVEPRASGFPGQGQGCWFVLHTRSRQEKILARELDGRQIAYFLPIVRRVRYYGVRRAMVEVPLFPGYLFLRGSLDEAYAADRTHRVAQIIEVGDQARIDWELKNVYLATAGGVDLDPYPFLKKGVRVEVRAGPLRGLQGVVEDATRKDRLVLQVDVLGRASSLEIDGSLLDVLD